MIIVSDGDGWCQLAGVRASYHRSYCWCEVRNKTVVWYGDQCAVGIALMNILLLIYVVRQVYGLKKYGVWFVTDKVPKMVK